MSKKRLIYYNILNYQNENLQLMEDHFEVIPLSTPAEDSPAILATAEIILAPLGYYLGKEKMLQAPLLKVIGSNTTGHPHIDLVEADKLGIHVVTLKGDNAFLDTITPTAELTWALVQMITRNIRPAMDHVLTGHWNRRPFGGERMLSRMSLGVLGYGRLGSKVAAFGQAFGMTVYAHDPHKICPKNILQVDSIAELVTCSDIVTLHVPHEPDTENLVSAEVINHFRPGSFFVNTSRGELVDHSALLVALESGRLAGVALDVVPDEFSPNFSSIWPKHAVLEYAQTHSSLLLTPHIGGSTRDAWTLTERRTIKRILEHLSSATP